MSFKTLNVKKDCECWLKGAWTKTHRDSETDRHVWTWLRARGTSWDQSSYAEHECDGGQFPSAEDESDSGMAEDLNCMSSPRGQKLIVITFGGSVCVALLWHACCVFFFHAIPYFGSLFVVCVSETRAPTMGSMDLSPYCSVLPVSYLCHDHHSAFQVPGLPFFDWSPMAH